LPVRGKPGFSLTAITISNGIAMRYSSHGKSKLASSGIASYTGIVVNHQKERIMTTSLTLSRALTIVGAAFGSLVLGMHESRKQRAGQIIREWHSGRNRDV
jgi:hypothetical protein